MSSARGNATEAAVLNAFVLRGYDVLVPFGDGQPYDLVVALGARDFLRVQCKTARPVKDCVVFNGRSTDHGHGRRSYEGRADIFAAYFPPQDKIYLVPVTPNFAPRLRLRPARNNQKQGIRLAADYEFDCWNREALLGVVQGGRAEHGAALNFA